MEKGKEIKTATLVGITVLLILHLFDIPYDTIALYKDSPSYTRFTYQFFHSNWFHLIVNTWALLTVVFYYRVNWLMLLSAYIISVTVPASAVPTVGLSGILFALYGFVSVQNRNRKLFHSWVCAFIVAGFFISGINSFIHLHCYILSLLLIYLYECCFRHISRE